MYPFFSSTLIVYFFLVVGVIVVIRYDTLKRKNTQQNKPNPFTKSAGSHPQAHVPLPKFQQKDIFGKAKKHSFFDFNQEIDCDLDERVFGPKNQHKDVF